MPPFLSPLPLTSQVPPVPTTAYLPVPPAPSPPPLTILELVALQYTAQPYSAFVKFRFPLDRTPPPLLPPLPGRYSHLPSDICRESRPVSRRSTWSWKPPSTRPIQRLTTHVYAPKRNTDWKTALKKNLNSRGLKPSLLRILAIILQTACAFVRFWITTGQTSYAADSTLPKYLKDMNISRMPF